MLTEKQRVARRLWADALESGHYEQCRLDMKTSTGHCCLHVAQLVAMKQDVEFKEAKDGWQLPPAVRAWLGTTSGEESWFASFNDGFHMDFRQIAQIVRLSGQRGGLGL